MACEKATSILGFPALEVDPNTKEFRFSSTQVSGVHPGTSVWLGLTDLGEDTLDFFFRSLLTYLSLFRRVMVTPGGPRRSDQTGIRSQAIPLAFALDPDEVSRLGVGEALLPKWLAARQAVKQAGLSKYVEKEV